ncbi:zinc finger protein 569-like [Pieris napi]|uniref:zinc finger protein 569-like n=1 Tax=Pieris napi TaxID=78633 RepID=UPI001FB9EBF1|nr:zinc finger protein 569-like [Pieris napi]
MDTSKSNEINNGLLNRQDKKELRVLLKNEEIYSCRICTRGYLKSVDYKKHILLHVTSAFVKLRKQKIYRCKLCPAGFLKSDEKNLHLLDHAKETFMKNRKEKEIADKHYYNKNIVRKHECPDCSRKFTSINVLEEHSKLHQPFPYVCFCGIAYLREVDFKGHQKLIHGNNNNQLITKTVKEEPAKKMPKVKTKSIKHIAKKIKIKIKHDTNENVECSVCCKIVKKHYLPRHMDIHLDNKAFKCNICNKSFKQNCGLYNHMSVHKPRHQLPCQYCGKVFKYKCNLINHLNTHTGVKPHVCKFCNKPFADRSALVRHERIHKKEYKYFCDKCDKKFTDISGLIGHRVQHSGKQYVCEICNKSFHTKYNLMKHLTIHIDVKKFECDYCNSKFTLKAYLFIHIKTCKARKAQSKD